MYEAGAFDAVESLLGAVGTVELDEFQSVRAEILHAEVSFARVGDFMDAENESRREREKEAILRLLTAAERLGHLASRARARGSPRSAAGGVLPSRL